MQRLLQPDKKKLHLLNGLAGNKLQRRGISRPLPLVTLQLARNIRFANIIRLVIDYHQIAIRTRPAPRRPHPRPRRPARARPPKLVAANPGITALTARAIRLIRRWRQERRW